MTHLIHSVCKGKHQKMVYVSQQARGGQEAQVEADILHEQGQAQT